MKKTSLVLFAGLPGTGKSTLAYRLAQEKGWCLLTKDQISRSLQKEGIDGGRAGYDVLLDLAELNLKNSVSVILDASFGFEKLRQMIQEMAERHGATLYTIECTCSDENLLKGRLDSREEMVPGWQPADWAEHSRVKAYWEKWDGDHLKLDAIEPLETNYRKLLEYLHTT